MYSYIFIWQLLLLQHETWSYNLEKLAGWCMVERLAQGLAIRVETGSDHQGQPGHILSRRILHWIICVNVGLHLLYLLLLQVTFAIIQNQLVMP